MSDHHPNSEEQTVTVSFTFTDLSIMVWGFDSVSWADEENEKEWDAATGKISDAYFRMLNQEQSA